MIVGAIAVMLARVMPFRDVVRVVVSIPLLLVMPGFSLTVIAFPTHDALDMRVRRNARLTRPAFDVVERATFSVLFSIIMTSGVVYALAAARSVIGPLTPPILAGGIVAANVVLGVFAFGRRGLLPISAAFALAIAAAVGSAIWILHE